MFSSFSVLMKVLLVLNFVFLCLQSIDWKLDWCWIYEGSCKYIAICCSVHTSKG